MKFVTALCLLPFMAGISFADNNATSLKLRNGNFKVAQSHCGMCADNATACRIKCNGSGTCIQACDDAFRDCIAVVVATVTPVRNGAGSVGYDAKLVQRLKPSSSLFVFRGLTQANAGASAPDRRKPLHDTCSKRNFTVLIPRPVIRLDQRHENVELVTLWRPNGRSAKLLDLRNCGPVGFISADRADLHGGPLQNLATVRASVAPAPMSSPPKACTVQTAFWLLPLSNSEAIIDVTETLRAAARRSERS